MPILMPDIHQWKPVLTADTVKKGAALGVGAWLFRGIREKGEVDSLYLANARVAQKEGVPWGGYIFIGAYNPEGRAKQLFQISEPYNPSFYVVDWENYSGINCRLAVAMLNKLTSKPVIEYSGVWARTHGGPAGRPDAVMVPAYGYSSLPSYFKPVGYDLAAWQYTNGTTNGTNFPKGVPGIGNCDMSIIYLPEYFGIGQQEDTHDMAYVDFKKGWKAFRAGDNIPNDADDDFKWGYQQARWASTQPTPPPANEVLPHTHEVKGTAT